MSDSHVRFSGHGRPALVAAAHGTRSETGTATIRTLLSGLRSALPDVQVVEAWVDVRQPDIPAALASIEGPVVLVPLLLSVGYHVRVDIPLAVAGRAQTIVAPALGPDPLAARAMAERLREARSRTAAGLASQAVLVAAGSSDGDALTDLSAAVDLLAAELGSPVRSAVLSAAEPTLEQVLHEESGAVEIAAYLLA